MKKKSKNKLHNLNKYSCMHSYHNEVVFGSTPLLHAVTSITTFNR